VHRRQWMAALRTPVGAVAAGLVAVLVVLAIIGPAIWGDAAGTTDMGSINAPPSAENPLGTDALGRDILARVLVATRTSLGLALAATAIGVTIGLVLGTLPSVLGRRSGRAVVTLVNFLVAFPGLLLALFFAAIFGVGARGAVAAIGLASAPAFARLVQTLSATVAGRDYVAAARIAGVGRARLVGRHILPNIAEPLVVSATTGAGAALLAFAGLSFLGLGVQAPTYDWGRLLGEGLSHIYINPVAALAPGVAVVTAGLAFALFGEASAAALGLRATRAPVTPRPPVEGLAWAGGEDSDVGTPPEDVVLDVQNLTVAFGAGAGAVRAVDGVSLTIRRNEAVGLVGESGSGKSLTALSVAGLAPEPAVVAADRLHVNGCSVLGASDRQLATELGTSVAVVFQDPATSLNPSMRVGRQLAEVVEEHEGASRSAALAEAVQRLRSVRIPAAQRRATQFPYEFSGGMRQRAMIGMGLMGQPSLIVADEPTTALDVTVQRQVLRLLRDVQRETGAALLLISHDIAVVSQMCERVAVMYAGRIVEELPVSDLMNAAHPYTRALLASVPDMSVDLERELATIPGQPPEPARRPVGCAFAPRCAFADEQCTAEDPPLAELAAGRHAACWHPQTTVAVPEVAPSRMGGH